MAGEGEQGEEAMHDVMERDVMEQVERAAVSPLDDAADLLEHAADTLAAELSTPSSGTPRPNGA